MACRLKTKLNIKPLFIVFTIKTLVIIAIWTNVCQWLWTNKLKSSSILPLMEGG